MIWFKKMLEKILKKNKIKLLDEPKITRNFEDNANDFFINLRKQADIEQDDGNGYKIIKNIRLKDMV